jgi:WXG100 family type VII secretion target
MSETEAQSAMMEQTAGKFESTNGDLQSMLRNLLNQLEALQGAWAGRGAQSFHTVKQRWADDQGKLQQALLETASAIRSSGQNYDRTDTEASSRMNSISGGPSLPL